MPTLRELIEARISAELPEFKEVAGAARLDDILKGQIQVPGAYLYRLNNTASDNSLINAVSQYVPQQIAVVVATRNYVSRRASDASDENEYFCELIQQKLLGWEPGAKYDCMTYGGGSLVVFKNGLFLWREIYKTGSYIRNV